MRSRSAICWSCLLCLLLGCSSSSNKDSTSDGPTTADDLVEVAGLLRDHGIQYNRGPSKLTDMAENEPLYTRGYLAIKTGQIVVIWGVAVSPDEKSGGTGIVAYEKKVETEGGNVLLQNGTIKKMSPDEFRAAPKAK